MRLLKMDCIAVALVCQITLTSAGSTQLPGAGEGHHSGLLATVTAADGTIRTVKLEGVGCSASMCSRSLIKIKNERNSVESVWLDRISEIRETTDTNALFLMRDGAQRRLSLVTDFRVLYLGSGPGSPAKLDLGKVRSLQFISQAPTTERDR